MLRALIPKLDTIITITLAIITPNAMDKKDFLRFIPNSHAARVPVYAPVTGKGTATNRANPR